MDGAWILDCIGDGFGDPCLGDAADEALSQARAEGHHLIGVLTLGGDGPQELPPRFEHKYRAGIRAQHRPRVLGHAFEHGVQVQGG